MKSYRKLTSIILAAIFLCIISGCSKVGEGETYILENKTLGLELEIPTAWDDIAVVKEYTKNWDSDRTGSAIAFTLYEKSSFLAESTGLVWGIQVYPAEYELEYDVDSVVTVNGRFAIGEDENWRYLAYLPTDVQYFMNDKVSSSNYKKLQMESPAVIKGFLEKNGISANEEGLRRLTAALRVKNEVTNELTETLVGKVKTLQKVTRWFADGCSGIEVDGDAQYSAEDGTAYMKVIDPDFTAAGIHSIDSLKEYLCGYFTVEYVDKLMEEYSSLFMDAGDDLYVLTASGATSYVLKSPEFSAEYVADDKIRLTCECMYQLFSGEPEPRVLEFDFVEVGGEWLCCSSPDMRDWSRILFDEGELAVDIPGSEWSLDVYPNEGNMIFTNSDGREVEFLCGPGTNIPYTFDEDNLPRVVVDDSDSFAVIIYPRADEYADYAEGAVLVQLADEGLINIYNYLSYSVFLDEVERIEADLV